MYNDDLFNKTAQFLDCLLDDINRGLDGAGFDKFFRSGEDRGFHGGVRRPEPKPHCEPGPAPRQCKPKPGIVYHIRADYRAADGVVTIRAELPGFAKEDIAVDYCNEAIIIRADRNWAEGDSREDYVENNRRYGAFERRFHVGKVDRGSIHAGYADGVLTITCNRKEDTTHSITIE